MGGCTRCRGHAQPPMGWLYPPRDAGCHTHRLSTGFCLPPVEPPHGWLHAMQGSRTATHGVALPSPGCRLPYTPPLHRVLPSAGRATPWVAARDARGHAQPPMGWLYPPRDAGCHTHRLSTGFCLPPVEPPHGWLHAMQGSRTATHGVALPPRGCRLRYTPRLHRVLPSAGRATPWVAARDAGVTHSHPWGGSTPPGDAGCHTHRLSTGFCLPPVEPPHGVALPRAGGERWPADVRRQQS